MTDTGLDHHDCPVKTPAGGATEGHHGRADLVGGTAAGVGALAAVPGPVDPCAVAALVHQSHWHH